jgi:hypothetical protein
MEAYNNYLKTIVYINDFSYSIIGDTMSDEFHYGDKLYIYGESQIRRAIDNNLVELFFNVEKLGKKTNDFYSNFFKNFKNKKSISLKIECLVNGRELVPISEGKKFIIEKQISLFEILNNDLELVQILRNELIIIKNEMIKVFKNYPHEYFLNNKFIEHQAIIIK